MSEEGLLRQQSIAVQLHKEGYVLLHKWRRDEATIAIGRSLGSVVDISALYSLGYIPNVQTLRPNRKNDHSKNHYSGTYGLDEFPLHTDLAHWARPPRYLILRCQEGSRVVTTSLLSNSTLVSVLGAAILRRALARPRRITPEGIFCALPLLFYVKGIPGFRWDPLFLVPMNEATERVAELMKDHAWSESEILSLQLAEPGDTLILDNWRFLHGRSKVPHKDVSRKLERLYLSEFYT